MNYKELRVWQRSVDLVTKVYEVTSRFPTDERYCLTNQMRRATISISSDIAEGHSRKLNADFSRFLRIAFGSCSEMETQVIIACKLSYIDKETSGQIINEVEIVQKMLNKLISTLKSKVTK